MFNWIRFARARVCVSVSSVRKSFSCDNAWYAKPAFAIQDLSTQDASRGSQERNASSLRPHREICSVESTKLLFGYGQASFLVDWTESRLTITRKFGQFVQSIARDICLSQTGKFGCQGSRWIQPNGTKEDVGMLCPDWRSLGPNFCAFRALCKWALIQIQIIRQRSSTKFAYVNSDTTIDSKGDQWLTTLNSNTGQISAG